MWRYTYVHISGPVFIAINYEGNPQLGKLHKSSRFSSRFSNNWSDIECAEFLSTVLIVWPSKTNSKKFTKSIVVCSFLGWTYCFIARPVRSVPGWRHLMANPICQAAALADGTEYLSKGMSKQCTGHVTTCTLFGCEWCDLFLRISHRFLGMSWAPIGFVQTLAFFVPMGPLMVSRVYGFPMEILVPYLTLRTFQHN